MLYFVGKQRIIFLAITIAAHVIAFSANRSIQEDFSQKVDKLIVRRTLPNTSPAEAYRLCLRAWREKNLGLWLPPAILWKRGDEKSGIGLVLARIPPAGLLEGIVDAKAPTTRYSMAKFDAHSGSDECVDDDHYWMEYKVLNPSIITWPVRSHRGLISFRRNLEENGEYSSSSELEWIVEWEPMPLVGNLLRFITAQVVNCAASYVASGR